MISLNMYNHVQAKTALNIQQIKTKSIQLHKIRKIPNITIYTIETWIFNPYITLLIIK